MIALWRAFHQGNLKEFFESPLDATCSIITIIYAILSVVVPVSLFLRIKRDYKNFKIKEVREKYSVIAEGLKYQQLSQVLYNLFFLMRRNFTVFVLVYLGERQFFQVSLFIVASIFNLSYLVGKKPFINPKQNKIEIMNEASILLVSYVMFQFINPAMDFDLRELFGTIFISIVLGNVLINLSLAVFETFLQSV